MREKLKEWRREIRKTVKELERKIETAEGRERSLLILEKLAHEYLISAIDSFIKYLISVEREGERPQFPEVVSEEEVKRAVFFQDERDTWTHVLRLRREIFLLSARVYSLKKKYMKRKDKTLYRKILTMNTTLALLKRERQLYYLFLLAQRYQ